MDTLCANNMFVASVMCVLAGWQQRGFCFFIGKHTHQHTSCSIGHVCGVLWHYSVFRRICVQGIFVVVFVKVHEMAICSCGECPRIFWQPFLVARFSATILGRLLLRNGVYVDRKLSYIICNSQFIQCSCALKGLHILKALKSHCVSWPFLSATLGVFSLSGASTGFWGNTFLPKCFSKDHAY